ncbi:hypothetical protein [Asanoa sp. NPDC050611]|uniref:hypothetical protein n=1 Tax=Asanoa sp. NPDC050611 TaxID=3157098 RepID=UPI00340D256F
MTATDVPATAERDSATLPEQPAPARRRWRWPDATPALLGYGLVRLVGLLILLVFAHNAGKDVTWLLSSRFDAGWYRQIAVDGYNAAVPLGADGSVKPSNLAFFPLYPMLTVAVTALTPLSWGAAGLLVAWLSGFATAWGLFAIGKHLRNRTFGVLLAMLWGVLPHALVQSMAYSESLLAALCAWSLYALLRRQWLLAGTLCLFAGLTRPTANGLIAAVVLTALVAVVRRQDGWRPWVGAALAPLGYLGYLTFVGLRLGRLDGYFYVQGEGWHVAWDWGRDTLDVIWRVTTVPERLEMYAITLLILLSVALLVLIFVERYPLPLLVYSLVSVVFVLGAGGSYHSKGRQLMPVFTLLLPIAMGLTSARRRTQIVVMVVLAVISGWFGAYLTLVWAASP